MSKTRALKKVAAHSISVAVSLSKGIAVQAKGRPTQIVAYAAAAGIVLISASVAGLLVNTVRGVDEDK